MAKQQSNAKTSAKAAKNAVKVAPAKSKDENQTWAVGTQVEHPAHGRGVVSGHTQTDGIVLVQYVGTPSEAEGLETVASELKLVKVAKPVKAEKKQKQVKLGFVAGDRIISTQTLGGNAAQAIVKVIHEDQKTMSIEYADGQLNNMVTTEGWVKDKKAIKQDAKSAAEALKLAWKRKALDTFTIGTKVAHANTPDVQFGTVVETSIDALNCDALAIKVADGKVELHQVQVLQVWKKPKVEKIAFKDVGLLAGFKFKGNTHVKVGNTSAIRVPIHRDEANTTDFVYLATPEFRVAPTAKVRFKVTERVEVIPAAK
jgi:hypothetical protein